MGKKPPIPPSSDPFGIASTFLKIHDSWLRNSQACVESLTSLMGRVQETNLQEMGRLMLREEHFLEIVKKREEILDMVKQNAETARKIYTLYQKWLHDVIEKVQGVEEREKRRAAFWVGHILEALAPSNFLWTNPAAVQRFFSTQGESLRKGFIHWLADRADGNVLPCMVDTSAFRVGKNIATTPGAVIYRNDLLEIIQYRPATDETYAIPVVLILPWINKFYIFDLSEETSFVRYLTNRGFTVFITSWRNPTTEMRNIAFDDYMLRGALQAVDVARSVCGVKAVHAAGYCVGGTALAALMAWLNRKRGRRGILPVMDWTVFSSLVDYSEPGDLGFFITEESIATIEEMMREDGYLDGRYMDMVFRILRADSLIWRNFVNNYLYGGMPPRSDMLFWNSDCTRLPETMCSFHLREFYLHNRLCRKDALTLGGRPIDLGRIRQPLYAVGALQDHICPWRSTFSICRLVGGPVRYVLANEGHITGIVNPPSEYARKKYRAADDPGNSDPDVWRSEREEQSGSWWEDWVRWLIAQSGPLGKPPDLGSPTYPPLVTAPGKYVNEP